MFKKPQNEKKTGKESKENITIFQVPPKLSRLESKDLLDYYWKYFDLQSHQRNLLCQFYVTLIIALIAAFMYVLKQQIIWAEYAALGLILLTVTIFGFMFHRSTKLRNAARALLERFEDECVPYGDNFKLFHTKEKASITYSKLFYAQLIIFGLACILVIVCISKGWLNTGLCSCQY